MDLPQICNDLLHSSTFNIDGDREKKLVRIAEVSSYLICIHIKDFVQNLDRNLETSLTECHQSLIQLATLLQEKSITRDEFSSTSYFRAVGGMISRGIEKTPSIPLSSSSGSIRTSTSVLSMSGGF